MNGNGVTGAVHDGARGQRLRAKRRAIGYRPQDRAATPGTKPGVRGLEAVGDSPSHQKPDVAVRAVRFVVCGALLALLSRDRCSVYGLITSWLPPIHWWKVR